METLIRISTNDGKSYLTTCITPKINGDLEFQNIGMGSFTFTGLKTIKLSNIKFITTSGFTLQ